jgi:NTE family protein
LLIDGVFSGGGIKGFALIGAYEVLEKRGLKFKRIAGTSAGAIISSLIAAGYSSREILQLMEDLDLKQFLDERKSFIPFPLAKWFFLYWRMGLYKGNKLESWLQEKLCAKGIQTFGDLPKEALRVIASDLTNGKMLVLPDDLESYGIIAESFPIAKAVRMSCSLPYFFEPVKLKTPIGKSIVVDGGVLSNFPIWLFQKQFTSKSVRPVIGIKLNSNDPKKNKRKINNALDMYAALFETMKEAHDARHIPRKHEKNIIFIPIENALSTEFHITEEKKRQLINIGREKTEKFLKTWTY